MLKVRWLCDACHIENVCDVSLETHFFAVILMTKRDHASLSPTCKWDPMNVHGWLLHCSDKVPDSKERVAAA